MDARLQNIHPQHLLSRNSDKLGSASMLSTYRQSRPNLLIVIGRNLDRMVHGVSVGALEFNCGPPRLCLFECMK